MTSGRSETELSHDEVLASAVQFQLMIIGESCSVLSEAIRNKMPEIPFAQIKAFRNRIVHAYFSLDPRIVWDISQNDVPELAASCEPILEADYPETHERYMQRQGEVK